MFALVVLTAQLLATVAYSATLVAELFVRLKIFLELAIHGHVSQLGCYFYFYFTFDFVFVSKPNFWFSIRVYKVSTFCAAVAREPCCSQVLKAVC